MFYCAVWTVVVVAGIISMAGFFTLAFVHFDRLVKR